MEPEIIHLPFDADLLPITPLKAGALTCLYEKGNLRYIKWGDIEIVRMIYGAVRDDDWYTAPYEIEDERVQATKDSFHISYTAFYTLNTIRYKAFFTLEGRANRIAVSMKGEALSSFKRNRIGLCVHHPINECAGQNVMIEQPDGKHYESQFPIFISPHQPFLSIKKMHWKAAGQVACSLQVEGDVFETEDQRNWTDSSYKTYSTPLALPRPVQVNKGETIAQRLLLEVAPVDVKNSRVKKESAIAKQKQPFPKIGYARPTGSSPLTEPEIRLLQQLPFDHYRVELHFTTGRWKAELRAAQGEAKRLGTRLELLLFFYGAVENEVTEFISFIQEDSTGIASVLPVMAATKTTTSALVESIYGVLKKLNNRIKVGYGTDGFFADLNRNRPQTNAYDFVSFSLNPQVHLSDTRSLIENLEAQADVIKTAKTFCDGKAVHVSPITFKIRNTESRDEKESCGYDARQHTFFGAFWTLSCFANLNNAHALTFCQTTGPCGILAAALSAQSTSEPRSPLYNILVRIKQFGPKWIGSDASTHTITLENNKGEALVYTCAGIV